MVKCHMEGNIKPFCFFQQDAHCLFINPAGFVQAANDNTVYSQPFEMGNIILHDVNFYISIDEVPCPWSYNRHYLYISAFTVLNGLECYTVTYRCTTYVKMIAKLNTSSP